MTETVVCYLQDEDKYLFLYRDKKENDINHLKWIGIGGHLENGETPEQALLREVKEETNLELLTYQKRGVIIFQNENSIEKMHVYTSHHFTGQMHECNEGTLRWIKMNDISHLNLWEGDRLFLPLLIGDAPFFSLQLVYKGERLIEVKNLINL